MRGMENDHPLQTVSLNFKPQRVQCRAGAPSDAPVRFTGVAYSGGVVPSYGWLGDVAIDLATLQNPDGDGIPVLIDHDACIDAIAGRGTIRRHTSADGLVQLHIEGELTTATEAGRRIAQLMGEAYPLQMSVGMVANLRETKQPVPLNGRTLSVAAVFEQPLIREVSFVAIGADPDTLAQQRLAATAQFSTPAAHKETTMPRTAEDQALIERLQADAARLSAQVTALQAEQTEQARQRRTADLGALFAELGRELPVGDAAAPYLGMSDASYAAFAADLRTAHQGSRRADAALFGAQSPGRAAAGGAGAANAQDRGKALLSAVTALTTAPAAAGRAPTV